jgi:hypothetical protein
LPATALDPGGGLPGTHPNRELRAINERGDVYLYAIIPEAGSTYDFFAKEKEGHEHNNSLIPSDWDTQIAFNSSRDFVYSARASSSGRRETVTLTRSITGQEESLWSYTARNYHRFEPLGLSGQGGSVYATAANFEERMIPCHVKSATEHVRVCPGLSDVPSTSSFGNGTVKNVSVSSPVVGDGITDPFTEGEPYTGSDNAGYVAFNNRFTGWSKLEAYVLAPVLLP